MTELLTQPHERIIVTSPDDSVELRELIVTDAPDYFRLVDYDREHLKQFGDRTASKYPTVELVEKSILRPEDHSKVRFGIWDGEKMVGSNNLTLLGAGRAELGSWVGKEHLGNHYAARARKLLIDFAFNQLGLRRLESRIALGNEASRKSVESSGFRLEETLPYQWVYVLGSPDGASK